MVNLVSTVYSPWGASLSSTEALFWDPLRSAFCVGQLNAPPLSSPAGVLTHDQDGASLLLLNSSLYLVSSAPTVGSGTAWVTSVYSGLAPTLSASDCEERDATP